MCYLCVRDSRSRACVCVCACFVCTLYAGVRDDCPRARASMFFYYFCFCFILFSFHFVVSVCVLAVRARCCPRAFSTCACVLSVIYTGMPACMLTNRVRARQYFVFYFFISVFFNFDCCVSLLFFYFFHSLCARCARVLHLYV